MTRGGYRAEKSSGRSKTSKRANMPSIPTTVTQQGGTSSSPSSLPVVQTSCQNTTQGGDCAGKSSSRTKTVNHANMLSIQTTVTQQGCTSFNPSSMPACQTLLSSSMPVVQTSGQSSTPTIPETSPVTTNQIYPIGEGISNQINIIGEGDSSGSRPQTLVFLTSTGLESSKDCSSFISLTFRNEVDPNGIGWKGVSKDVKDGYFEEFKTVKMGRDPTPSELHLHVHTHGHDKKAFVGERSRLVHEKYEEILREKTQSQSDIDQCEAYYQAAGGENKRRIYGLGSEAKSYYGTNLCASSSLPPSVSRSTQTTNLDNFVKQLIPVLTNHFLPIVLQCINGVQEVSTPTVPDLPNTTDGDEGISSFQ